MDNGESSYRRFLSGEDEGMLDLIREYQDGLILYINSIVQNIHTAEDIAEDTFTELAVRHPVFSGRSSFKTWLYSIARNKTGKYLRRGSRRVNIPEEIPDNIKSKENVEDDYIKNEQRNIIYRSLRTIKPEYGQVIYLSYFENMSNEESAVVMKKNKRQIEALLYNAKKALKIDLERSGFEYGKS